MAVMRNHVIVMRQTFHQTGSEAHPASDSVGAEDVFLGIAAAGSWSSPLTSI
jgi:hypothetical protein